MKRMPRSSTAAARTLGKRWDRKSSDLGIRAGSIRTRKLPRPRYAKQSEEIAPRPGIGILQSPEARS